MQMQDEPTRRLPTGVGTGSSVLVVDDEGAVRRFAMRVLEREGFRVFEASHGGQALDMVRDGVAQVDVVVSDIVMPNVNGVELLLGLKSTHPELPVILMSGYATAELTELGIAAPCGVISKPFPAERLLAEVQRCIKGTQATRS
jgi:two-component system, cell cycle sensor histidine kinase and response regulator CckA